LSSPYRGDPWTSPRSSTRQADRAEVDAADAIEFAGWTVDHPRLAVLDAIDARDYTDDLAQQGRRQ